MKKHILFLAMMVIGGSFLMTACNKNSSAEVNLAGKQQLSLYLTDGPGLFDKVLIDIKSVKVLVDTSTNTSKHDNEDWEHRGMNDHMNESSFVWENLNITPGIYDMLQFRNGADTLLASTGITNGFIRLIKIELGTNNSLVKDSISYPVSLPPFAQNYILIKLKGQECEEYLPGKKRLWLDFDITRSIKQENNNQFILRPVFHFYTISSTGSIKGKVLPKDGFAVVTVFNATDTAYALPDREGSFKLRGLKDGNYSVFINASNGYVDTTITNVSVTAPKETSVGLITLHK